MKAAPDKSIRNLFGKGRHIGPTVANAGEHRAVHRDLGDIHGSEHRLDDTRNRTALNAVSARVFRATQK